VPVYVRDMLFSDQSKEVTVLGVKLKIFAYEPIVWVSLTRPDTTVLPPDAPKFPALVDTGNTLSLTIQESHLTAWTRPALRAADLPLASGPRPVHDASGNVVALPRREATLWLHHYPEGTERAPLDLEVSGGILVYEASPAPPGQSTRPAGPHLPLLGARAFRPTGLSVQVDYQRLLVNIDNDPPIRGGWIRRLWHKLRTGSLAYAG
jgi:hypothetical protein